MDVSTRPRSCRYASIDRPRSCARARRARAPCSSPPRSRDDSTQCSPAAQTSSAVPTTATVPAEAAKHERITELERPAPRSWSQTSASRAPRERPARRSCPRVLALRRPSSAEADRSCTRRRIPTLASSTALISQSSARREGVGSQTSTAAARGRFSASRAPRFFEGDWRFPRQNSGTLGPISMRRARKTLCFRAATVPGRELAKSWCSILEHHPHDVVRSTIAEGMQGEARNRRFRGGRQTPRDRLNQRFVIEDHEP